MNKEIINKEIQNSDERQLHKPINEPIGSLNSLLKVLGLDKIGFNREFGNTPDNLCYLTKNDNGLMLKHTYGDTDVTPLKEMLYPAKMKKAEVYVGMKGENLPTTANMYDKVIRKNFRKYHLPNLLSNLNSGMLYTSKNTIVSIRNEIFDISKNSSNTERFYNQNETYPLNNDYQDKIVPLTKVLCFHTITDKNIIYITTRLIRKINTGDGVISPDGYTSHDDMIETDSFMITFIIEKLWPENDLEDTAWENNQNYKTKMTVIADNPDLDLETEISWKSLEEELTFFVKLKDNDTLKNYGFSVGNSTLWITSAYGTY